MVQPEPEFEPHALEEEARRLWESRDLPPSGGMLGPREGPIVLQFEGSFTPGELEPLVAHRAVAADVDARYLSLAGRRALGTLRYEPLSSGEAAPSVGPVLGSLGIWTGGDGTVPWDREARHARVETLVGRLAHRGVIVSRDLPLRACPTCGEPRSPERIVYQEEEGDTYVVRFELPHEGKVVRALVWVDSPWRLLGTSALLVHPDLPYVIARYRRKESEELVLTSRSSIERFRKWIPGATFEVLEEHPGRFFEGRTYDYPLRHEFPTGGALAPPAGTVLAVADVTDTGTGVVPLVPGHGSTDATIAASRGVTGWPLVTPRGQLDLTLMHKYSGLDLRSGSDFIVRDLTESDAIFATLRVRRGVPHCAVCGSALLWIPGRAWCLEPGRLPSERLEQYHRLLPDAPALDRIEVAPWPVSETQRRDDPAAVALLECAQCERLEAMSGPVACPCGGRRYPVRRLLVPSVAGALAAWSRLDPFPLGDPVHLYVGKRRRVPTVVHHLTAIAGLEGGVGDLELTLLPTVSDVPLPDLLATNGADAVRAAFVRAASADGPSGSFTEHCRVERGRIARLWTLAKEVIAACDAGLLSSFVQPAGGFLAELEVEDRALLARWERVRVLALADYDHWRPASVHRRVFRFLANDLELYRAWVRPRLSLAGTPPTKRGALRTLVYVLRQVTVVLGPILPHTCEAIHRRVYPGRTSLFEGRIAAVDRTLIQEDLIAAWDRWRSVVDAVADFRREQGLPADTVIPSIALVVAQEELGAQLRAARPILERLAHLGRVDVGSPQSPWEGRQHQVRPVESEIQRFYPSQTSQLVHLLRRLPPRRASEAGPAADLSVVIQGQTLRVFPSMVEYVDTLPSGVVPRPWTFGEMYLELPAGTKPPDRVPPPLSADAFWLVRRLERRLRRGPPAPAPASRSAIIQAAEPLASELRQNADAVARYLGLREVRVPEMVASPLPPHRLTGRTRTGATWWVDVPGWTAPSPRTKHRPRRPKSRRIPEGPAVSPSPEVNYASEEVVSRWQSIRSLGIELDGLLGLPLLGPTKLSSAWDQGLNSIEAYRNAPFDQLQELAGFGREVASLLVTKFGGAPPPARTRPPSLPSQARRPSEGGRRPAGALATPSLVTVAFVPPRRPGPPPPLGRTPENLPPHLPAASAPEIVLPVAKPASKPPSAIEPFSGGVPPTPPVVAPEAPRGPLVPTPVPEELPVPPSEPTTPKETVAPETTSASAELGAVELPVSPPLEAEAPVPESAPVEERSTVPESPPVEEQATTPESPPVEEQPTVPESPPAEEQPTVPESPPVVEQPPAVEPSPAEVIPEVPVLVSVPEVVPEAPSPIPETERVQPPSQAEAEPAETAPETPLPATVTEATPETLAPPPEVVEALPPTQVESAPSETGPTPAEAPLAETTAEVVTEPEELAAVPGPATEEAAANPEETPSLPVRETVAAEGAGPAGPVETAVLEEAGPTAPTEAAPVPAAAEVETETPGKAVSSQLSVAEPTVEPPPAEAPSPPPFPEAPAVPPPTPPKPPPAGIEVEFGPSLLSSILPFLDATAAGHRGICVVRESPERVAAQVGPRPVDVYWLSNLGRGKSVRPNDLAGMFAFLTHAVEAEHVTAFFLEGIEYLIRIHGAEAVVKGLTEFNRVAKTCDARVWIHLTAALLRPDDLAQVVASFGPNSGAA